MSVFKQRERFLAQKTALIEALLYIKTIYPFFEKNAKLSQT